MSADEFVLAVMGILLAAMILIGLPWLIFHYVTKWKTAATLTREDENLLDQLNETARRLDDRLDTIERIMTADNPNWKQGAIDAPIGGGHEQISAR